ncbi:hypothetical protein XELAEV_18045814mg [Xenopus laevis]|uniref:Uncharacterized protein n=1 Tax=Xenopus laevis TaxID=8355 RepID=A0A974C191_XENLA|nr:hypothetical protein XELAEV_18045814mg [Xenopus laevis]
MDGYERTVDYVRDYIQRFSLDNCALGNQGYNRVLLQLFGYMGHGKSSLINSCKYVLDDGEYHIHANALASHTSVTFNRTAYPLTDTITIVDNRGCSTFNAYETGEIYAQLGNFIPLNEKVEWTNNYEQMIDRLEDSEMDPNFTDFTIPVFVYRGEKKETKEFIDNCQKMTGVFPIVVLTHKTCGDFIQAEKEFLLMGVETVIKIENYTEENHGRTQGRHKEILNFLYSVLEDVNFQMRYLRNPRKERIERKKFLLNFLHNREMKQKEEQMRRHGKTGNMG